MLLKDMLPTLLRGKMRHEALRRYLPCPWANQEKVCRTELTLQAKNSSTNFPNASVYLPGVRHNPKSLERDQRSNLGVDKGVGGLGKGGGEGSKK